MYGVYLRPAIRIISRVGIFLGISLLFQIFVFAIAQVFDAPILTLAFGWPGWVLVFAGRAEDPPWGLARMVAINVVFFAPLFYFMWRPFQEFEDHDGQGE